MTNPRFKQLSQHAEHLFIPFIMAGDPSPEITIELALMLQESGAHLLELGVPYSDPLADGPVIQQAAIRALRQGMSLEKAMKLVSQMRERGLTIPVVIFTYFNPVLQIGEEKLFELMKANDVDGLLIPDLPFEESEELNRKCEMNGFPLISLVAPTSQKRVEKIAKEARGFLYCVSSLGVTGVRKELDPSILEFLTDVRKHAKVPVAVGFGISSNEQVEMLKPYCHGIIVGSALIKMVESKMTELLDCNSKETALFEIKTFVKSIISA